MYGLSRATWVIILFSRITLNVSYRLTYPYLPAIARGLGISFERAGILVAARSLAGISGFFFGLLSERKGYRWGMGLGLVCVLAGACIVGTAFSFWTALAGFVLFGLAKTIYDPAVQSYVSANTSYTVRARAIGWIESSWASSWFLGIPLCGYLIANYGWNSPFFVIAAASIFALWLTTRLPNQSAAPEAPPPNSPVSLHSMPTRATGEANPLWVVWASFFMLLGNESMMIVYGALLENQFSLEVKTLGLYSILMGFAELAGELTVVAIVDRIGKRKAIMAGLILSGLSYVVLPLCSHSLTLTLIALASIFYLFEFTIVSSFPFVSELVPRQRAKWLAINYTFCIAGRLCGALVGPWAWDETVGLWANAGIALAGNVISLLLLWGASRHFRENGRTRHTPS